MKRTHLLSLFLLFSLLTTPITAQDWPDFGKFKEANTKLAKPSDGEQRIVFMGNSITIGWLQTHPEFFEGKPYINRGISGQTTPQMLVRFRADVIDLEASAVVILAGTNDVAGNTGPSSLEMILDNIKSSSLFIFINVSFERKFSMTAIPSLLSSPAPVFFEVVPIK